MSGESLIVSGSESLLVRITNLSKWDIHLQIFPWHPTLWPSWVLYKTGQHQVLMYKRGKYKGNWQVIFQQHSSISRWQDITICPSHWNWTFEENLWLCQQMKPRKNLIVTLADNTSPKRMKSSVFDAQSQFLIDFISMSRYHFWSYWHNWRLRITGAAIHILLS